MVPCRRPCARRSRNEASRRAPFSPARCRPPRPLSATDVSTLRVAYVLNVFPRISETFIAGELAELRRRGVEVRILSLKPPAEGPSHDMIGRAGLLGQVFYEEGPYRE